MAKKIPGGIIGEYSFFLVLKCSTLEGEIGGSWLIICLERDDIPSLFIFYQFYRIILVLIHLVDHKIRREPRDIIFFNIEKYLKSD